MLGWNVQSQEISEHYKIFWSYFDLCSGVSTFWDDIEISLIILSKQSTSGDPDDPNSLGVLTLKPLSSQATQAHEKNTNIKLSLPPSEQTHVRRGTRRRLKQHGSRKRPGWWRTHCLPLGSGLRSDTFLTFVPRIPLPGPHSLTGYLSSSLRVKVRHHWLDCFFFFFYPFNLNKETAAIWSFRSASTVSKWGYLDEWAPFDLRQWATINKLGLRSLCVQAASKQKPSAEQRSGSVEFTNGTCMLGPLRRRGGVISAISVCANTQRACLQLPSTPTHPYSLALLSSPSWTLRAGTLSARVRYTFLSIFWTNVTGVGHSAERLLWVGAERVFSCMNLRFSTLKAFVNGAGSH